MTDPVAAPALLRTPLFEFHRSHAGHMVPFAGWEMPLYYESILAEHEAVRRHVGLFDVSHMGILTVTGAHAAGLLSRRTTANISQLVPGQCRYTFLLDAPGLIVDDLLVTRLDEGEAGPPAHLVVPNAAHATEIFDLLRAHRLPDTKVLRHNGAVAILAVQGPGARPVLEGLFGWRLAALKPYHARLFPSERTDGPSADGRIGLPFPEALSGHLLVSRTGYTGEPGYELFVRGSEAPSVAERLLGAGVRPCGLGARDTLRLEKGYLLSGQDFHRDRTPLEAGQDRFVDLGHAFVGREALVKQTEKGLSVRLVGIESDEPDVIPRHGTVVVRDGAPVAEVTSGGLSPSLRKGIALAYLPKELTTPGTPLAFALRGREAPAHVRALPFYPASTARR